VNHSIKTAPLSAAAATMLFSPDSGSPMTGAIDVVLPIDKMGNLPLPRGRIKIQGNTAELSMIPEWQFDRDIVLYGTVLDTRIISGGKQPIIRGVILWKDGAWLEYFDNPRDKEDVIANGRTVSGRITEVVGTSLEMDVNGTPTSIPLSAVSDVNSGRVFEFEIPTTPLQQRVADQPFYADARSIAMRATARPFRVAQLRSTIVKSMDEGDWSTKRLVAIGTALSLIELAQLAPTIAVPLGLGPGYMNQLRTRSFAVERMGF
jgi:hypothetical protein